MDQSSRSGWRPPQPPRKELQGPRPSPLKVRKDSHKIKKPPPVPQPSNHPPPQPRPPVIIYAVSPKIIHTNPSDFMTLVQRLTGADNSTATSNPPPSPAARFAAIEKTKTPLAAKSTIFDHTAGFEPFEHLLGTRPGSILSPGPAGLTHPVPPTFFSDPFSPLINLYHQHQHDHLNALQQLQNNGTGNYTYNGGGGTPSAAATAAAFLSPSPMISPASIEFLTRLLEQ